MPPNGNIVRWHLSSEGGLDLIFVRRYLSSLGWSQISQYVPCIKYSQGLKGPKPLGLGASQALS